MNSRLRWRSLDERVDLAGEQIDPGQQAKRAMAFVLMIPREAPMAAWHWAAIPVKSVAMAWIPGFSS